jgi:hypothetical protein
MWRFLKENKEFIPLIAAVIGLIAAIIGRKRVVVNIHKSQSVHVDPKDREEVERRLQLKRSLKKALGFLILCLIGLISSLAVLWYFSEEYSAYVAAHGKITPGDFGNKKGQVLLLFLLISYAGLVIWGLGAAFQLLKAFFFGCRCYFNRAKV